MLRQRHRQRERKRQRGGDKKERGHKQKQRQSQRQRSKGKAEMITSYKEYTDKEKISCWYQKDEYTQILKECKQEFREAKGESIPRGLEGFGKSNIYIRRCQEKKESINAVLSEQGLQWISGKFDEEAIATRYCSFTRASKWNALQVAFDDQECIS